jgi:hypothetical protein
MVTNLSQEDIELLINEIKNKVDDETIIFPEPKDRIQFNVIDEDCKEYTINIQRKGINNNACTYLGRIGTDILLRLDVTTAKHKDRITGEEIHGTHLHIGEKVIPFNTENKTLFELCFKFFGLFTIKDCPNIIENPQLTLGI